MRIKPFKLNQFLIPQVAAITVSSAIQAFDITIPIKPLTDDFFLGSYFATKKQPAVNNDIVLINIADYMYTINRCADLTTC